MIFGSFSKSIGGGFRIGIATRLFGRKKRSKPTQREKAVDWITDKADSMNRLLAQFPDDAVIEDTVAEQVQEAKDIAEHVLHAGGRMSDAKFRKIKYAGEALQGQLDLIPVDQRNFSKKYLFKDILSITWRLLQITFFAVVVVFIVKACNAIFGN